VLPFSEILARARSRHGDEALAARMPAVKTAADLTAVPDDRILAEMSRCLFQAGFVWRVIDSKWPGFEAAFLGFDPNALAALDEDAVASLQQDPRIVRNGQKIVATLRNACWVQAISAEHGGFGRWLAAWPDDDVVGLWWQLKQHGARLGGDTGPRVLRRVGRDTFILTPSVRAAMAESGVDVGKGTGKRDQRRAQDAFVAWREESGLPLAHLSMVLACSAGPISPAH